MTGAHHHDHDHGDHDHHGHDHAHGHHGHGHEGHDQDAHDHGHSHGSWWRELFSHDHSHHSHGGGGEPRDFGRAYAIGTALNLGFVVAEVGFGLAAGSLALVADAAHNLSDALGLLAAFAASWLGRLPPTGKRTYGYGRASIMAALLNAALLIGATGAIIVEAVRRLLAPSPVAEGTVIIVALIGILINGATAMLFLRGRNSDLNARGAYVHMVADAVVSVGVVIAAVVMWATGWLWIDPLMSLVIGAVILIGSWRLTRDTVDMALDAMPSHLNRDEIEGYLAKLPGVRSVHDLHVWPLSTSETALTAHLVRVEDRLDDAFLMQAREGLRRSFSISHATLQIEIGDAAYPCVACETAAEELARRRA